MWLALLLWSCTRPVAPLPGAQPRPPALERALQEAEPGARWVNRLALERSPYLKGHATDPVDWWPWGEEAFAQARAQDRLVMLSIGYATCHWCHVMQEESFRDVEVAEVINRHFVAIKVDREEHPDLDEIYQAALRQAGAGGWPATLWLTPDGQIVLAAGYLPPRDGDRGVLRGLLTVLTELAQGWETDRERMLAEASARSRELVERARPRPPGRVPGPEIVQSALDKLSAVYDAEHKGFGRAPKFPRVPTLDLLLGVASRKGDAQALSMATSTLLALADGGIHDVLGGGFHRYATDEAWTRPHYEKTTPDNAQLARSYVFAWQLTGEPRFRELAQETLTSLQSLALPEGGYGTALDADSLDATGQKVEGAYYTWTRAQVESVLPEPQATWLSERFGVGEEPGALHVAAPWSELAQRHGVTEEALKEGVAQGMAALRQARSARAAPLLDSKQLASHTGLVASAQARAAFAFGDEALAAQAQATLSSLQRLREDGRLLHSSSHEGPALLEDHAAVAEASLDLFALTGDLSWLEAAIAEMQELQRRMADPVGGWFRTPEDRPTPLFRPKPDSDGAEPSGLSVAVAICLRLSALTGDPKWESLADSALAASAGRLASSPTALAALVEAVARRHSPPPEIVMGWPEGQPPGPLLDVVRRQAHPGRAVVVGSDEALARLAERVALVRDKVSLGAPTVWVCRRGVCQAPATTPEAMEAALTAALQGG